MLTGCAPECEPRVVGTAESVAMVRDVIASTQLRLQLPLCVARVTLVDEVAPHHLLGEQGWTVHGEARRTPSGPSIRLRASDPASTQRATLVHELCHALSFRHGLADAAPPLPLGDAMAEPDQREEAFATWCDLGPRGTSILAQLPLQVLGEQELEVVRFLQEQVWSPGDTTANVRSAHGLVGQAVRMSEPLEPSPLLGFARDGRLVLRTASGDPDLIAWDPLTAVDAPYFGQIWPTGAIPDTSLPKFGLDRWTVSDTWYELGDDYVGRVSARLATYSYVGATVVLPGSDDALMDPAVLSHAGSQVQLARGRDHVLVQTRLQGADSHDLEVWAWEERE